MLKIFCAILALAFPIPLFSQEAPRGGESLFPKSALDSLQLDNHAEEGKVEKVAVKGQPFKTALRLTTLKSLGTPWDVQVAAAVPSALKAGDALLAEFWVRAVKTQVESGEANSEFVLERLGDPWTKAISFAISAGPKWRKFSIPFASVEDLAAGKSHICFRMGYRPQVFELGGLKLLNYRDKVKLADLPRTKVTYAGMEPDAPWRLAALDRIEKIRKGDLTVTVLNAKGKPVAGARVSVRMKRHAFGFGSAVVGRLLATHSPENDRYQKEVERLFNKVVFENDLKWGPWEAGISNKDADWRRQYVDKAVKWLSDRSIAIRGHNMVWGSSQYLPAEVKAKMGGDKKALEKAVENRIQDVGKAMSGKVVEWDVVNEPVPEHELTDLLGRESLLTWYKAARWADPKALLFVNDYPSPDTTGHLDGYDGAIKFLKDNGAPLGGIGLQGHVGETPWSIPALLLVLDRLGSHGIPVEITEYDTGIRDENLDAQFLKDFMTAIFSHPSVNGFLMWGFWDGAHWHKRAPIFSKDWTLYPSGRVYEDLVFHDWWTNAGGTANAEGAYQTRGFLGDYEVTVTAGSKTVHVPAKLGKDGLRLKVVVK